MKLVKALFVLALTIAVATPFAFAETQNVKVSGSLDMYGFWRHNFDLVSSNDIASVPTGYTGSYVHGTDGSVNHKSDTDEYFMSITQIQVSADLTDNVSTVVNLVNQRDWNATDYEIGNNTGALATTNTARDEFDVVLDLAYVTMREIFYSPLTLTIGRQDLLFGRGFIVGWNPQDPQGIIEADEFTQIQSFDAIRATLDFNPWTLDLVYSKIDENAHDVEDDVDLYIANINYKFAEYNAVAEGYYVGHIDRATLTSALLSQEANKTQTIGGRVQFDPISPITLGGELAYQFGNYRGAAASPERDREAWALDLFGTYRWDNVWKPEATVEYIYLSGENDLSATTAEYSAWNAPFRGPTYGWIHEYLEGAPGYGTGAPNDQPAGQNLQFISINVGLSPMDDLRLSATYYHYWSADDMHTTITDPNSSTLSDDIGDEIDTVITYAYTSDVTFSLMADWFIPGDMYNSPNDATASQLVSEVKVTF